MNEMNDIFPGHSCARGRAGALGAVRGLGAVGGAVRGRLRGRQRRLAEEHRGHHCVELSRSVRAKEIPRGDPNLEIQIGWFINSYDSYDSYDSWSNIRLLELDPILEWL